MDIEIQTHRIKTSQPRVFFMMDGPYIDGVPEEERIKDELLQEACDVFNNTLATIYGKPAEDSWAGKYYWPDWMDQEHKLAYALALTNFRTFMRHLAAEAYALHVDRNKDKKDDAIKTETP